MLKTLSQATVVQILWCVKIEGRTVPHCKTTLPKAYRLIVEGGPYGRGYCRLQPGIVVLKKQS